MPLEVLLREGGRDKWAESLRWFFEGRHRQWTSLQAWWDPTLRLLVRLQNRYWPLVQGSTRVLPRADGSFYDPEAVEDFDASSVVAELQVTTDDVLGAYRHLARRGFDLEFGDGWYLLRQMTPRARRRRFEGQARRAQDCYDAAEVVRRFYRDLTGEVLPDAEVVALAATDEELELRSRQRDRFLGHEPRLRYDAEDAKRMLRAIGIYPHGIHVIVEGESEEVVVPGVVESLLGSAAVDDVIMTNLRGVGGATRIEKLLTSVTDYALQTVLIVDDEGDMRPTVDRLMADGLLDPDDVLIQDTSFEESNFTDEELRAHRHPPRRNRNRQASRSHTDDERVRAPRLPR